MSLKPPSKIIVVTGPESAGKTTLSEALHARLTDSVLVQEYARDYLAQRNGNYGPEDIPKIAKGQLLERAKGEKKHPAFVINDTGLLVLKIWMEFKYHFVAPWLETQFIQDKVDLYLLCRPNIPWEPDPLRENPRERDQLFSLYFQALKQYNKPFEIVEEPLHEMRLERSLQAIAQL